MNRAEWKRKTYLQHYGTKMGSAFDQEYLYGGQLTPGRVSFHDNEPRYTMDELWPYHGFAKPIEQLATPHLKSIVEMFSNEERFIINSKGDPRPKHEEASLRRRVNLVRQVYNKRIAKDNSERNTNINRRIMDTKILLGTLRSRRTQLYNQPDADEYQKALTHVLSLLIDIQLEFNL